MHIKTTPKRNVYVDRMEGYKQALRESDIPFREDLLMITTLSQEDGFAAGKRILETGTLPDAIFVANDNCAVGCMLALKQAGIKIPHDVAFAGFNNDPVSKVIEPNLTTINYRAYEIGEAAARNLINHLNGTATIRSTNTIVLRSELIIRASSTG